jgi:pantoate--beta-alanine ligase
MGVEVVVVPTVRDDDGLALSSRNVYLTPEQRRAAPVVYRALCQAQKLWRQGERDGDQLRQAVRSILDQEALLEEIDYVSVADAETLEELATVGAPALVSVAVHLGRTRLIDNIVLGGPSD